MVRFESWLWQRPSASRIGDCHQGAARVQRALTPAFLPISVQLAWHSASNTLKKKIVDGALPVKAIALCADLRYGCKKLGCMCRHGRRRLVSWERDVAEFGQDQFITYGTITCRHLSDLLVGTKPWTRSCQPPLHHSHRLAHPFQP